MGDVHGAYRALKQCLERSNFDYQNDILINLGDVTDGWPQTKECIDELFRIKNLIYILGNHDTWALSWMQNSKAEEHWLSQGGKATVKSYTDGIPKTHISFLENALPYYVSEKKLFVHAGIDPERSMDEQGLATFLWDRRLANSALNLHVNNIQIKITMFDEVYLGHTPIHFGKPVKGGEVWLMDTGAGWAGVLSMMDINTKEVFLSDSVPGLYPGIEGRTKRS